LKDKDYIKGLIRHDKVILDLIYKNFAPKIHRFIVSKGGSVEDAKDVFQDALMVIYTKAKEPDFELSSQFYTYLYSVCRFVYDRKRKKKSNNSVTITEQERFIDEQDIEREIIKRERYRVYQLNFKKLGALCQELLTLFYAKKTMGEIAHQLELKNEHTARNRKYRCQKELEKLITTDVHYEELSEK